MNGNNGGNDYERQLKIVEEQNRRTMISGLTNFVGVILGAAAILILAALLISLLHWLKEDLNDSFTFLKSYIH